MKITAQEEYGLRILLRIARCDEKEGMSIPQLSKAEGITNAYIAKLTRVLRMNGFINSTPGNKGGYVLAKPATEINIGKVLEALGGVIYDRKFCNSHAGVMNLCTNSVDCSARSLWQMVQITLDNFLDKISLDDLIRSENKTQSFLKQVVAEAEA
jgi:Rrf2 family transcriptional regulator, iron-sulfur cluster assembly transcription factor